MYVCVFVYEGMYTVYKKRMILIRYIDSAKCPVFPLGVVLKKILQFAHQEEGEKEETSFFFKNEP